MERVPAEEMPYTEVFDGVLITRVFHEIPVEVRAGLFQACYRALKRPGVLLNLDFAYPDTLEEFRQPLFWAGVNNQYREMSWGTVHPTWHEQHQMLTDAGFTAIGFCAAYAAGHALPGCRPQALTVAVRSYACFSISCTSMSAPVAG